VVVVLVADMLEAAARAEAAQALEQAAAEVESVSAERASRVELRTLLAQDPASLHLGIHHMGGLSIPVQQVVLRRSAIVPRKFLVQPADRQFRPFARPQRLVGRRIISTEHAMLLGNGRR
jgi:hypothetical protein